MDTLNKLRRRQGSYVVRALIGGASVAVLLSAATITAKAEDSVTVKEIQDLKARLKQLEKRLDNQAKVTQQVVRQQAAYPPAPYSPPLPWDKKFHLNGITITPGGFFAMEGIYKARDTQGDYSPAFGSIPEYNNPLAHTQELNLKARATRLSLLVEGAVNPDVLVSGYGEIDFQGAGLTANANQSNSYSPRIRVLYTTVDWKDEGWHFLAGQNWSLLTLQGKGIDPRYEDIPVTIDAQYVAGFAQARQPGLRVTKSFGDTFWLAASAEMSQTTGCTGSFNFAAATAATPVNAVAGNGIICDALGSTSGGSYLNSSNYYSLNHIPDVIAKAAWEPTVGDRKIHLEVFGLYTDLYDTVQQGLGNANGIAFNNITFDKPGWGAGGSAIVPVIPKLIDVQGTGIIGRGIGRYGQSQLNDVTFNPDGSLDGLPEVMYLGGAIVHATPQLDLYLYGGGERILNADDTAFGTGYSPLNADNSGCFLVNGACKGNTESTWEITGGFWDKVYDGAFGSLRVGLQYAYIERELFPGTGASAGQPAFVGNPWFNEQEGFFSVRYYPFDNPPAAPAVVSKY